MKSEGYITVFKFPNDEALKNTWISAISRAKWTPTSSSNVCLKHFLPEDLSYVERFINGKGELCEYVRPRPVLCAGAVPKLFPGSPPASPTKPEEIINSPDKRKYKKIRKIKLLKDHRNQIGTFEILKHVSAIVIVYAPIRIILILTNI